MQTDAFIGAKFTLCTRRELPLSRSELRGSNGWSFSCPTRSWAIQNKVSRPQQGCCALTYCILTSLSLQVYLSTHVWPGCFQCRNNSFCRLSAFVRFIAGGWQTDGCFSVRVKALNPKVWPAAWTSHRLNRHHHQTAVKSGGLNLAEIPQCVCWASADQVIHPILHSQRAVTAWVKKQRKNTAKFTEAVHCKQLYSILYFMFKP